MVADPQYHFVIVCNGELDSAWTEKLDRIAEWLPNFEWHLRANQDRDMEAWRAVLNGEVPVGFDIRRIQRFILMNSSIRGPFLPEYFKEAWPEAVLGLLHSPACPNCELAGLLVKCNCESPSPSHCSNPEIRFEDNRAALDESLLAFDGGLFPLVKSLVSLVEQDTQSFAYRLSRAVLSRQGNWAVTSAMWKKANFLDSLVLRFVSFFLFALKD